MAIPSTGTTWKSGGFNDVDSSFLERGGKMAAFCRQAQGAATNLSPHSDSAGTVNWAPFAADGQLRDDLFAFIKSGGYWIPNPTDNEGFHLLGAFKEGDGPTVKSDSSDDDYMIEQSNFPFDSDRVKDDIPFTLTPVETLKPVLRRIRNGLPLVNANGDNLVEYPGQANTIYVTPLDYTPINYQFLLLREFNKPSGKIQTVKAYDLVKINKIGDSKFGKKDAEAAELTCKPLPSGFFMGVQDGEYQPIIKAEWIGGPGYAALYGSPTHQFTVTLGTQSSGTFTLTYGGLTTATIAFGAAASAVKSALVLLDDGFDASDWTVAGSTGGPYTVTVPVIGTTLSGSGASLGTPGTFVIAPV
jgi:hypothetical protein